MAGSLRTLGFLPPFVNRGVVPRLTLYQTSCAPFRQTHDAASSILSLSSEYRLVTRRPRATGGSDEADEKDFSSQKLFLWAKPFFDFVRKNFLPLEIGRAKGKATIWTVGSTLSVQVLWDIIHSDLIVTSNNIYEALVSGVSLGLAYPSLGHVADRYPMSKFSTVGIFFLSGLMLRSEEIGAAVEAWPAGVLGLISILFLTPFFSRVILQVHLNPHEFVTGLAIFCCMPTTLSSGVALTQLVGGNSALALAMTIISNFLGTMTVPFSLAMFVGGVGVSIPTMQLFKSLVMTLLVPLVLGKVLRDFVKSVAIFADQNRQYLSMTSAILLSLVPWIQVSRSKSLLLTVRPEVFATAMIMGALVHIILLALNTFAVRTLSMLSGDEQSILAKRENARAVIIVASQKTLPVMVAVVEQLRGALGEPGLLVLPCVAAHINQIIIDSFLVSWWMKDQPPATTKEA